MELGLKFTRVADESTSEFRIAKDRSGPVFLSREIDTMFILTAHLKGYMATNIKIDINEDGNLISISGEKRVRDTVMVGWKVYKKDTETKGFKKVFRIPGEVILDKIEANFDEDESTLTVSMPKKAKGIRGTEIEEVKENADLVKEDPLICETITQTEGMENQKTVDFVQERGHERENVDQVPEITNVVRDENGGKMFKLCTPIVASSMLVLSFVVFVFQIVRNKNLSSKRRD